MSDTMREPERYSSMTLPSSHLSRPISRGSAMSGEAQSLNTPLATKRRISLFETKNVTPHFNVEKMETNPYGTMERVTARASPRIQSPLAARVVRLDVTNRPSSHSVLARQPMFSGPSSNATAQRLAKAYQTLTSASTTRTQAAPVDPSRVHLIDPAQYFTKPKKEVEEPSTKVEPVTVKPVEDESAKISTAPEHNSSTFKFVPPTSSPTQPIVTTKQINAMSTKFQFSAPKVLVESNAGNESIWTCSDCDIANSDANDYCFSCGRSKASSLSKNEDVVAKRPRQQISQDIIQDKPIQSSSGPMATSTPFISSTNGKKPAEVGGSENLSKPAVSGVIGQWRCSTCLFMNDFKAVSCTRCSRSSGGDASLTSVTPAVNTSSRLKRRQTLEGGWRCGCQHMNPKSATACDLCSARRPPATPVVEVLKTTAPLVAPVASVVSTVASENKSSAALSTATATTTSLTAPIPAPAKMPEKPVSESTISASTTNSAPLLSTGFGNKFAPKEGQWQCPTCMIQNDKEKTKCAACETANPNAPKVEAKEGAPKFGGFAFGATATTSASTTSAPSLSTFKFGAGSPSTTQSATSTTTSTTSSGFGSQFAPKAGQWKCPTCMIQNDKDKTKCAACETPNPDAPKSATTDSAPKISFGADSSAGGFKFGMTPAAPATSTTPATTASSGGFAFGVLASTAAPTSSTTTTTASIGFGISSPPTTTTTSSGFGSLQSQGATGFFGGATAATTSTTTTTSSLFGSTPAGGSTFTFGGTTTSAPTASTTTTTTTSSGGFTFGSPATTTTTSSSGFSFGSTPATTASSTFSFGATSSAPATTSSGSTGFAFGSAPATTSSAGFTFGQSAPATTAAPTTGGTFAFGSPPAAAAAAPTTTSAPFSFGQAAPASTSSAAPAPFSFGATPASSAATPFAFASAATTTTTAAPAPATNGPSLFAFGSSAPATGGSSAPTAFGQSGAAPNASAPFSFGGMSQPTSAAPSATPGFNFSATPAFGSVPTATSTGNFILLSYKFQLLKLLNKLVAGTNGSNGGFKFNTGSSPGGFNFSASNPPAQAAAAAPAPAFQFNAGSGGFTPAAVTPGGGDGAMLFSSGTAPVANRPKAVARKLKVAGRK